MSINTHGINTDTKDLAGNTRLFDIAIDMGTYEYQIFQPVPYANGIVYVGQGSTGNGSSWANASNYLQGAINAADVVEVWVAKGTYQPALRQSFTMKHGVAIYGCFPDNDDHAGMDVDSSHQAARKGLADAVMRSFYPIQIWK